MTAKKTWKEISKPHRREPGEAEKIAAIKQAMIDVMALAELRQLRELSQNEVAETLGMSQPRVSKIERQEDLYLSTLAEYVRALGGELEVAAVFGEDRVLIGL